MARDARAESPGSVLKTALIGLGRIGWSLERDRLRYHPCTHAGTLRHLARRRNRFSLAAICDRRPEQLRLFQAWWGTGAHQSVSHRETAALPGLDLAVIAVSLDDHHSVASDAIRLGIPRLLIEKPVGRTAIEGAALLRLAHRHGTAVWVNFERRYHPAYLFVKRLLERNSLGPLRAIRGRVLTGSPAPRARAGPLLHDAVHWIDLLLWYAGKPRHTSARVLRKGRGPAEHTTFVRFDYPHFVATLETGGRRDYFEFEMELDFAAGRVAVGNEGLRAWRARPSRRYENFRELLPWEPRIHHGNAWLKLYQEILTYPATPEPSSSLADAVLGLRIVEQIGAQAG